MSPNIDRPQVERVDPDGDDTATVTLTGRDLHYRVRVVVTSTGPQVAELSIINTKPGRVLTQSDLDRIPLHTLAVAVRHATSPITWAEIDRKLTWADLPADLTWDDLAKPGVLPRADDTPRMGRPPLSDHHLTEVAELVRRAQREGQSGRTIIASRWEVSISTADRWLREARKRGLLD
ncbi:hypothetical protein ACU5JM_09250 [Rhodococcus erythropolis]|uniref:hypothetical protein n=1 Tax=Rhodococcus erythropolis TaxID=1833 RepID=UPI00406BD35A